MSNRWKGGYIQAYFDPLTVGPVQLSLYTWGIGLEGSLGQDNTTSVSSPVLVGSGPSWSYVAGGASNVLAIKSDGSLWAWGRDDYGALGLNTAYINYSSPVQVGALTTWSKVSTWSGTGHTAAIKTDGTLWTWGNGALGQLGNNGAINLSSPVQVGALTDWDTVSTGSATTAAIKTDGTLWTWGSSNQGASGQNVSTNCSSPIQVGALTNWAQVSGGYLSFIATKTDGTLWSWGDNVSGQLGQNIATAVNVSSPVQIGALTTWSKAVAGSYGNAGAVKTDGTLWTWGNGASGRLGHNNTTSYSSPVQVGALTDWATPSMGSNTTSCIKTDGTLWTWGDGANGILGQNNTTGYSSPVQVGAETDWTSFVQQGSEFGLGTRGQL